MGLALMSCQKQQTEFLIDTNFACFEKEVDLIIAENCCNVDGNFFTCENIKVSDINTIDAAHISILPSACLDLNSEVIFSNGTDETAFILRDKKHYLLREVISVGCPGRFESVTYIEQSNEVVELAFQNNLFGLDTIYIKLKSAILSSEGQTANPKVDRYSILHRLSFTNIANFYVTHTVGDSDFDSQHKTFHDSIMLNNESYYGVVEFKLRQNFHAAPHTRLYLSEELGFFGFDKNQELWLKL